MVTEAGRRRGCLLGGAIGDALGAPVEFWSLGQIRERLGPAGVTGYIEATGRITDDTQMTMFTAEGLIRAHVRWLGRGICHPPSVVWRAYRRWLATQEPTGEELDGWLVRQEVLHAVRAPGNTCLSALRGGRMGSPGDRVNDSKGCGGVMRVAPVGLMAHDPFGLGCDVAALTHGHPSGFLAAGAFALMIGAVYRGASVDDALTKAEAALERHEESEEVLAALRAARRAAAEAPASPETVETLGEGWVAEEALAIAVYCALAARDFRSGVLLAVNHSGDSDSTGSMTGNLLGALWGAEALPEEWLAPLEAREEITALADDLGTVLTFTSDPFFEGMTSSAPVTREFAERYPGG